MHMTAPRRSDVQAGFTLLEMLVTLALLSLLCLTLFGSIHYGSRIWEASHATTAAAENVREAQQEIAGIVSAAYPKFTAQDATHASIAFDGQPSSLRVLAPDGQLSGALSYYTLRLAEVEGARKAVVMDREVELAPEGTPNSSPQVLLRGVKNLIFRYFVPDRAGGAPQWTDRWQNQNRPPLLVRIHAELSDRRAVWPDIAIGPRIAADVGCTLDALTKTCQGR
jgi:general secretion pathway protein J